VIVTFVLMCAVKAVNMRLINTAKAADKSGSVTCSVQAARRQ